MSGSPTVNVDIGDIIGRAAQSTLGILALSCVMLGFIAYTFFKDAGHRLKLVVFLMIFCGTVGFAIQVFLQQNKPDANRAGETRDQGKTDENGTAVATAPASPLPRAAPNPPATESETPPGAAATKAEETPEESDQAASSEGAASPSVFIDRVTSLGTEDPSCQKKDRFKGKLVSGIVYNPIEVPPPHSKCYVRMHFDVQETPQFKAPFQITFFNSDGSGNGNQILSATVNKLPNRFQVNLGRINIDGITAYIYQPGTTSSEADKRAPTVVGTIELSY